MIRREEPVTNEAADGNGAKKELLPKDMGEASGVSSFA